MRVASAKALENSRIWLAASILIVATAWLLSASGGLSLGDAPESIAGAKLFGVLHAPGYIIYSALGWFSIHALPMLTADVAVMGVSLVSSFGAVVLVFVTSRTLGVSRLGASVAALLFGLSTSVWFYSGYAKHTATTTLVVTGIVALLAQIDRDGRRNAIAFVGALLGLSLGLGWPVIATVAPVVFWVVWLRQRTEGLMILAATSMAGGLTSLGLTFWRGTSSPAINWGEVNSLSRLRDLVTMRDFGLLSSVESAEVSKQVGRSDLLSLPTTLWTFAGIVTRNTGILTVLLAAIATMGRGLRRQGLMLSIALMNLLAVSLVLGVDDRGIDSVLIMGGFTAPTLVAIAVMAGDGLGWLVERSTRAWRTAALLLGIATAVGVMAFMRFDAVRHPQENLPLIYAQDALAEVPQNGSVVAWQAERTFPFRYAQVVHGLREDVAIIAADGLNTEWYRDQLQRDGLRPVLGDDLRTSTAGTVENLVQDGRAVHLDMWAWEVFGEQIPNEVVGITAAAFPPAGPSSTDAAQRIVSISDRPILHSDLTRRWPNEAIMTAYARSSIILADQALARGEDRVARVLLETALLLDPENETVRDVLETLTDEN